MSQRHFDLVAFLGPCADARRWLLGLPDETSALVAFSAAGAEWQRWVRGALKQHDGSADAHKALVTALPCLVATVSTGEGQGPAFWQALRASVRGRVNRRAMRKAHPADAWTIPRIVALPVCATRTP